MEQKINLNRSTLSFETFGDSKKSPLVLIHGFPFNREMWEPQIQVFAQDYFTVTYDLRGMGKSIDETNQFTLEILVEDLFSLLDFLKLKKVNLLGFSMGGYVALRAIERSPERFQSLILADTQSAADGNEGKLKRTAALKTIQDKGLDLYSTDFLKAAVTPITFEKNLETVQALKNIITQNSVKGASGSLLAMISRTDTTDALKNIKVKTLILVGDQDKVTPIAKAKELTEQISGSTLSVISNSGHMSSFENPLEFNKAVLGFLSS